MYHSKHNRITHFLSFFLALLSVVGFGIFGMNSLITSASTNKEPQSEKVYVIAKNKKTLKNDTLNTRGFSLVWKEVLTYKIKSLRSLKQTVTEEKGTFYSTKQAEKFNSKIDKLIEKYKSRLKKIKNKKVPVGVFRSWSKDDDGMTFSEDKL